jgi:hypothetical protein
MNHVNRRTGRRRASEPAAREHHVPDSLRTADGVAIPVWDAQAADPIAYLASVMDLLPGSGSARAGRLPTD